MKYCMQRCLMRADGQLLTFILKERTQCDGIEIQLRKPRLNVRENNTNLREVVHAANRGHGITITSVFKTGPPISLGMAQEQSHQSCWDAGKWTS